jgi:hypothetical protein
MKLTYIIWIVNIVTICTIEYADQRITLFLKPYPVISDNAFSHETAEKLRRPGKVPHHILHGILQKDPTTGLFASYGGYLTTSDFNGQISFPLQHSQNRLQVLITDKITPIIIADNVIDHWETQPGNPSELYTYEKKYNKESGLYFWNVEKESLPTDKDIPPETIIIFTKPKNIFIPTGVTPSNNRPNLVLPDIYVKKGIKIYASTLYILNIRHFFGTLGKINKKHESGYSENLVY